jgi:hypothetical protein
MGQCKPQTMAFFMRQLSIGADDSHAHLATPTRQDEFVLGSRGGLEAMETPTTWLCRENQQNSMA